MIAFTIGYEMSYSNIVNMLQLSSVPIHSAQRQGLHNMVFAGGVCAFNPEPLAEFIDFFSTGEGEDSTVEIVSLYQKAKREAWSKEQFLWEVSKIQGVYVPSFYTPEYNPDGTLKAVIAREGAPKVVTKRIVENLDTAYFPTKMIVPSTEIVHDRSARPASPAARCGKKARRYSTVRRWRCWKIPATTKLLCPVFPPRIIGG